LDFRFRIYDFNAGSLWRTRRGALNTALCGISRDADCRHGQENTNKNLHRVP
jgi:hypothetical protein